MKEESSNPPRLVYDGECDFCKWSIRRWRGRLGSRAVFQSWNEAEDLHDSALVPPDAIANGVILVEEGDQVSHGAEAVFRLHHYAPGFRIGKFCYHSIPGFSSLADTGYAWISSRRRICWKVVRLLWGRDPQPVTWVLSRWIFNRLIGLVYLVAFVSWWIQLEGLVGSEGILPVADFLNMIESRYGTDRYRIVPTLMWFSPDNDGLLHVICMAGCLGSLCILFRWIPVLSLIVSWLCYLSLVNTGQIFLGYQWDMLLLETGFLAILFAPWKILPRLKSEPHPPRLAVFLLCWLLFRLVFSSGMVKITGQPSASPWLDLTAMAVHYETQPLPTVIGWFFHQFPAGFHKFSTFMVIVMELGIPILVLLPRVPRLVGCAGLVGLQVMILLTGNYTFFNYLSLALCILLIDDAVLIRFMPRIFCRIMTPVHEHPVPHVIHRWITLIIGVPLLILSLGVCAVQYGWLKTMPSPVSEAYGAVQSCQFVNRYGLFAHMTTDRPELRVFGSHDGREWKEYIFKWKPGDPHERPRFIAPHQPRLDWQMWFAALGQYQDPRTRRWLEPFLARLLEGSQPVLDLLREDPFQGGPPRYVVVRKYDYRMSDWDTLKNSGRWWDVRELGSYSPYVSVRQP
jgi:predicted DCC family thiol-disulfide oxidoreductase YuxK